MMLPVPIYVVYSPGYTVTHALFMTREDALTWRAYVRQPELLVVPRTALIEIKPDHPGSAARRIFSAA